MKLNHFILWVGALWLLSPHVNAAQHYVEFNGGMANIRSMDWIFPSAGGTSSDPGVGAALGYFYNLTPGGKLSQIHFGIRQDFLSAKLNSNEYLISAPVGLLRFHFLQFYLSGGFTPILLQRNHPSWGLSGIQKVDGTYAFIAEGGLMYGINPQLSMGINAGAWMLYQQGFLSASYSTTASVSLRFYIREAKGGGGSTNSTEYTGWRYIGK